VSFRYRALGLDILSPFACPGFWPVQGAGAGREVTLELGPVPPGLSDPIHDRPLLQIDAAGAALYRVPGVARYHLRERAHVRIALEPGASLERALEFVKSAPLALLCHQWGLAPLEAACLERSGRALLLGSLPGAGKSTLALALADHGFRLMSDGLCALEARPGETPLVWPAFPQVKAWPDSLAALDIAAPGEAGPGGRHTLAADAWFEPSPRPPMAVVTLRSARGGVTERVARKRGAAAFETVMNLLSLSDAMRGLGPGDPARAIANLAAAAPVFEARYPRGFERLADLPGWLLERLALADALPTAAREPAGAARAPS
jgi:hypothetical protein